jgi:short-subunit dehydrogenase
MSPGTPSSASSTSSPTASTPHAPAGLQGRVALVTGASAGIGLAVARHLVAAGARVALVARTRATLESAVAELGAERAAAFPCDVGDMPALEALPGQVLSRFGALDILINNAGLNHRGPIAQHPARSLADIINVNLTAPIVLTRLCAEHLRPGGAVVNIASLAGMVPVPHEATYSASKAGLRAFTRALDEELQPRGLRALSVCPGPVDTGFFGDHLADVPDLVFSQPISSADQVAEAVMRALTQHIPEVALPAMSGRLATLGYLFPELARLVRPLLEKRGARAKARFMASYTGGGTRVAPP